MRTCYFTTKTAIICGLSPIHRHKQHQIIFTALISIDYEPLNGGHCPPEVGLQVRKRTCILTCLVFTLVTSPAKKVTAVLRICDFTKPQLLRNFALFLAMAKLPLSTVKLAHKGKFAVTALCFHDVSSSINKLYITEIR